MIFSTLNLNRYRSYDYQTNLYIDENIVSKIKKVTERTARFMKDTTTRIYDIPFSFTPRKQTTHKFHDETKCQELDVLLSNISLLYNWQYNYIYT